MFRWTNAEIFSFGKRVNSDDWDDWKVRYLMVAFKNADGMRNLQCHQSYLNFLALEHSRKTNMWRDSANTNKLNVSRMKE